MFKTEATFTTRSIKAVKLCLADDIAGRKH